MEGQGEMVSHVTVAEVWEGEVVTCNGVVNNVLTLTLHLLTLTLHFSTFDFDFDFAFFDFDFEFFDF